MKVKLNHYDTCHQLIMSSLYELHYELINTDTTNPKLIESRITDIILKHNTTGKISDKIYYPK